MSDYACAKCGSTGFIGEMRRCVVSIGANAEVQAAGIVPVRRCANDKCGILSTPSQLNIGDVVNLQPIPPQAPTQDDRAAALATASKNLETIQATVAALEAEAKVTPPAPAAPVTGANSPAPDAPPVTAETVVPGPDGAPPS